MIPPESDLKETTDMSTAAGGSPGQEADATPDLSALGVKEGAGHAVDVKGLHAYYGEQHAVKGIDIRFPANEVTAIIGPSGCGKSTMVRCINRMHEEIPGARAEGSVTLDELDVYGDGVDVTSVRRMIGMVFQKPNPFPDHVDLRQRRRRAAADRDQERQPARARASRRCARSGCGARSRTGSREPGTGLSGGQQQRLCIARTIAVEPEVILMDEPCSALDPIATLRVEELIDELKDRYTIVIVTHNMQQAARVANSTAFMLDGELIEHAPTNDVFTNPRDERTERYVTGKFG